MKRNVFIKPAVLAGSALFAGFALAGDPSSKAAIAPASSSNLAVNFGAGYSSDYVFRGSNYGDDLVEATIGVSGSGSLGGLGDLDFAASLWLGTASDFGGLGISGNEMDISFSASKALSENLSLEVGVTNYSYYGDVATVQLAAALDDPANVSPLTDDLEPYVSVGTSLGGISLGVAAHFNEGGAQLHDMYWEFTAGYEMEVSGNVTLGLSGLIGHWDEVGAGAEDTYYGISAGLSIAVSDSITVTPYLSHTIDGNQVDGTVDDETVAGVSVGFGF